MTIASRLAVFALVLTSVGGAAYGVGMMAGHDHGGEAGGAAATSPAVPSHLAAGHGGDPAPQGHGQHGAAAAAGGLRLVTEDNELRPGERQTVTFAVEDRRGRTVRDFDVAHDRRMHVIVVRRDLTGFQHLHPRQRRDGSWELGLSLPEPGVHRLFADFEHAGRRTVLATDLLAGTAATEVPLPAPAATAEAGDGYTVSLPLETLRPRSGGNLAFTIRREGKPVHPQPYLGARGHLVVLRESDLRYLHAHPASHDHGESHDATSFAATIPAAGRYRLFFQFRHGGRVRTAAFTRRATG